MADEQDDIQAMLRAPLLYNMPEMDAVTAQRDIAYRGEAESGLHMDVYTPHTCAASSRTTPSWTSATSARSHPWKA